MMAEVARKHIDGVLVEVAEGERLRDRTGEAEDEAYNLAISHAAQAIRGLKQ